MVAPTRPTNYSVPFAQSGTRNTIAATPTGDNHASFSGGFPPITMEPITEGGIPPSGADFNGIYFDIFSHIVFINAGGQYQFDSALSTAMGGYPAGFILQNNAGTASYVSLVDNNTTDFNATPSSIGTLWGAYSGAAFSNTTLTTTGGSTTLTAVQSLANLITVTGVLTSNAVLIFPATLGEWIVVNATTGAFTLACVPAGSGVGVPIKQGAADAIYCTGSAIGYQQASAVTRAEHDGSTSIATDAYADRAASHVGGFSLDTGTLDNYVIATVPPTTSTPSFGITVRFLAAHGSSGGPATLDAGFGPVTFVKGDGGPLRAGDASTTAVSTATYVPSVGKWILNGLIVPDATLNAITTINATQTLIKGQFNIDTSGGPFACNLNGSPSYGDVIRFFDGSSTFGANKFTLLATGGKLFKFKDLSTGTTYIVDVPGEETICWYNGTNWILL